MNKAILLIIVLMIGLNELAEAKSKWISLLNGKDLNGWFVRGKATWTVLDGVWFEYRIKAVGAHIQFWIDDKLVMTYDDSEYKSGHFAIQGHNPGMKIEAKALFYRSLDPIRQK